MKCATHPEVETNLRCAKCGKPICPKCMVQTPVGARCPDCAGLYKVPTYQVSAKYYLRAIGAGLGMAVACGVLWWVVTNLLPFLFLNLLLAPAFGYTIAEVSTRRLNRSLTKYWKLVAKYWVNHIQRPRTVCMGLAHYT